MPTGEKSHAQLVLSTLNQQRAEGRFCDAMLNLGGGVVYLAHCNILACFSELFQESNVSTVPCMEFCLHKCPRDGLELLLNFVYTGELKLDWQNLECVQHAATSLCMPEALALCRQFKETSEEPSSVKQKRGRPRKSALDPAPTRSVKEESVPAAFKDDCGGGTAALGLSTAAAGSSTTTRSGRVVKGPRWLVTEENSASDVTSPEKHSRRPHPAASEGVAGVLVVENQIPDQLTGKKEVDKLSATREAEDEDAGDFEGIPEDTDEEYVPAAESGPTSPSASAVCKRRPGCKAVRAENGAAVGGDAKRDSVQCPVCDKTFKSKYYLKVHNRRHTGERPFSCLKCGKSYFRKENLLVHETRGCTKVQQRYTCTTCTSTFDGKEELRLHLVSHTGQMPHKCSMCTEQFMRKKSLTLHMMRAHSFPKPHACSECPKTFLSRTELRVHEAGKHRGEKPYVCEECGHRACSRNGLQMHIKAVHRNERPFVCNLCGHAFSQKNNLTMHLRVHSGERPFQCHLCGKTFRSQASLDKHNRTHTGERPYGCDVCEQRFTEKGALVRHKASRHEEGRPHCCHICGKTFKAKEQLRVHVRRHKGARKFECVDCGYKFTRLAHLRRHVKIHKRTENYNPRQRKLRNVVVQELDESPAESEAAKASLEPTETHAAPAAAVLVVGGRDLTAKPEVDHHHHTGLSAGCVVDVMIHSGDVAMDSNLGHMEAAEGLAMPEVLQQSEVVTEAFESSVEMVSMVESISEAKS